MKIVHVTQSLRLNSGVSVFVAKMANLMARAGHEVTIVYTELMKDHVDVEVNVSLMRLQSLSQLDFKPDVVHVHGIWSVKMALAMRWCRIHQVNYYISPHGGVMPGVMRKGWLKKHLFYCFMLHNNLRCSLGVHCTGQGEADAVRSLNKDYKTFIVPLGCDILNVHQYEEKEKIVLFMGRISEEKGLLYLVDAWGSVSHNGWKLVLAGPDWRGFRRIVEERIADRGVSDIEFYGVANQEEKDKLYKHAGLFVLSSPTENFSMAVLDALSYAVPVICTQGCPWEVIKERKCGWCVLSRSSEALAQALREGISMSNSQRLKMGEHAQMLAREYDWATLSQRLISIYFKGCGYFESENLV